MTAAAGASPAAPPDAALRQVRQVLQDSRVPAAAVVLMQGGRITLAQAQGQADLTRPGAAAGPDTLFKLGSLSKSVTALAVALLVDEGKLSWDAPASRWLPELQAADPRVAGFTLRQLLTHSTGLDLDRLEALLWPQPNAYGLPDLLAGIAALRADPREAPGFHYSNLNYALVGQIVARASGQSYGRFVAARIFKPLGMDCTAGSFSRRERPDLAQPHRMASGRPVPVRTDPDTVTEGLDGAPGGVRCSARGLGPWLQFHLAPEAAALAKLGLSQATWRELHQAQVVDAHRFEPGGALNAFEAYGLGLQFVGDARGLRIDHYGGLAGIAAYMAVYPARRSGLAVAINGDAPAARGRIVELLQSRLGLPPERPVEAPAPPPQRPAAPATRALEPGQVQHWQGRYRDPWFGEVQLCAADGAGLRWRSLGSPRLVGRVVQSDDGRPLVLWDDPSVQSDAWLVAEPPQASGARPMDGFRLAAVGEPDFDFSAIRLVRLGGCQ